MVTYLVNLVPHLLKARVGEPLLVRLSHVHGLVEHLARAVQALEILAQVRREAQRVVVRLERDLELLQLDPAAGPQVGAGLAQEPRPVGDGAAQVARVDEVEGPLVEPGRLGVLDLEVQVGRHPAGLDGAEVGADHFGAGRLVGKVDGPDASAGAHVEHALHVRRDGGAVEGAAEGEVAHMVEEVLPVLLILVVGQHVLPFAVDVVPPAVLVLVVAHSRDHRAGVAG